MLVIVLLLLCLFVLVWWSGVLVSSKTKNIEITDEPRWIDLVNDFKTRSQMFNTMEQFENYLSGIDEKVRSYETDYSFLVAFNSIKRDVTDRLKIKVDNIIQ